jgi:hypothetical protein
MISILGENEFVLGAQIKSQCNLLSYIWNEEGGWVFLLLYPLFGLGIMFMGHKLSLEIAPDSPGPELARFTISLSFLMGLGAILFPYLLSMSERWRIRRALHKVEYEMLLEGCEMFEGSTPSSSA